STPSAGDDAHGPGPDQRRSANSQRGLAPPPPVRPTGARRLVHHAGVSLPLRGKEPGGGRGERSRRADVGTAREGGDHGGREARCARARRLPHLPRSTVPRRGLSACDGPGGRRHTRRNGGRTMSEASGSGQPPVPEPGSHFDLQPDVERLHRPITREPRDPIEGREPVPWFFTVVVALALFWGGWYLGRYSGEFGVATHVALRGRDAGTAASVREQTEAAITD